MGPLQRLPKGFGWIRRLLPETAQFAGVLSYLLRDPETVALLEKTQEAGPILRPLCEMLGVKAPEFLRRRRRDEEAPAPALAGMAAEDVNGADRAVAPPPPRPTGSSPVASLPVGREGEGADVMKTAQPPPAPVQTPTVAWHLRPGGLYWDGRRWQWS
jgi:hypothetical protein